LADAATLLDRDHGIGQFDQIFLLHVQQLLADFIGLLFGREAFATRSAIRAHFVP